MLRTKRSMVWIVCGLTLLALGLRLYRLGTYSLWYDEAFQLLVAEQSFDTFPPKLPYHTLLGGLPFNLLLGPWANLVGRSDWWLRLLPVLLGTATVPAIYRMARNVVGRGDALVCAAFLAIHPLHIYYSQTLRREILNILLVALAIDQLLRHLVAGRRRSIWLYGLLASSAVFNHPFCLALFAALGLYALLTAWRAGKPLRGWIVVHLLIAFAGLVFFLILQLRTDYYGKDMLSKVPDTKMAITMVSTLFVGYHLPGYMIYPTGALAGLLFLYGFHRQWRLDRRLFFFTVIPSLTIAALLLLETSLQIEAFVIRFYTFFLPIAFFHLAYGIRRLPSPRLTGAVTGLVLFLFALSASQVYQNRPIREIDVSQRSDYRGIGEFILANRRPGDAIGHFHASSFLPLRKYTGHVVTNFRVLFDEPECIATNNDNRSQSELLGSLVSSDRHVRTELPRHSRVWMIAAAWQADRPIYDKRRHLWRRRPVDAAFDWMLRDYRQVSIDDHGTKAMSRVFDNREWLQLYLFELKDRPDPADDQAPRR